MNGIGFENMKVFKQKTWLDFANITLLTGTNNSGKSSIINALKILKDNLAGVSTIDDLLNVEFKLRGNNLINFGSIYNLINNESNNEWFAFSLVKEHIEYTFKVEIFNNNIESVGHIKEIIATDFNTNEPIFKFNLIKEFKEADFTIKMSFNIFLNLPSSFNFSCLWESGVTTAEIFNNLICKYYGKPFRDSYLEFCNDLLKILSGITWGFRDSFWNSKYILGRNVEDSRHLVNDYGIDYYGGLYENCFQDFGLSILCNIYNSGINNCIVPRYPDNYQIHIKEDKIIKVDSPFLTEIIKPLSQFIVNFENKTGTHFRNEFDEYSNIKKLLIKQRFYQYDFLANEFAELNFISSNRKANIRTHSLNDASDIINYLKLINSFDSNKRTSSFNFINKWLKEFEIAEELIIEQDAESGTIKIFLLQNGNKTILNDFGFGANQLLPIIIALACPLTGYTISKGGVAKRVFVIEEPEANLHPALQSKLADLIVSIIEQYYNANVKFIIETHSEYLIRKLQYLTAKGLSKQDERGLELKIHPMDSEPKISIRSSDSIIHYFYTPNHPAVLKGEVQQVEKIMIRPDGILDKDFGKGFFDESAKWSFELLKIQNSN